MVLRRTQPFLISHNPFTTMSKTYNICCTRYVCHFLAHIAPEFPNNFISWSVSVFFKLMQTETTSLINYKSYTCIVKMLPWGSTLLIEVLWLNILIWIQKNSRSNNHCAIQLMKSGINGTWFRISNLNYQIKVWKTY